MDAYDTSSNLIEISVPQPFVSEPVGPQIIEISVSLSSLPEPAGPRLIEIPVSPSSLPEPVWSDPVVPISIPTSSLPEPVGPRTVPISLPAVPDLPGPGASALSGTVALLDQAADRGDLLSQHMLTNAMNSLLEARRVWL